MSALIRYWLVSMSYLLWDWFTINTRKSQPQRATLKELKHESHAATPHRATRYVYCELAMLAMFVSIMLLPKQLSLVTVKIAVNPNKNCECNLSVIYIVVPTLVSGVATSQENYL